MRSGGENGHGSDDSEERTQNETQAVQNHGGKLPVTDDVIVFVLFPVMVGDLLDLSQDGCDVMAQSGSTDSLAFLNLQQ